MKRESKYNPGALHELMITLIDSGWTDDDFSSLAKSGEKARNLLAVHRGERKLSEVGHDVDCSKTPFVPDGWRIAEDEHQIKSAIRVKVGLTVNSTGLQLVKHQKKGVVIGHKMLEHLEGQKVLPANVLDYFLENQELIPEIWKSKAIFFWGTVYRGRSGDLYVRYLYGNGGRWDWDYCCLDDGWRFDSPAAVLAS